MRLFFPQLQSALAALLVAAIATTARPSSAQVARPDLHQQPHSPLPSLDVETVPLAGGASPQPSSSVRPLCPLELDGAIDGILDAPAFASAQWGVLVEAADAPEFYYDRNSTGYFIPASNVKLLTTAAALQTFDPYAPQSAASLRNWIGRINRDSHNATADALLNQIGGPGAVRAAMGRLGVDPFGFRQVDGSGLSRYNMAKPATFVAILRAMQVAAGGDVFYESLPVAGWSGTLRHRFQNTAAQGRVRAKTGTLRGVRALSGYLNHPDYGIVVFSILVNQPGQSGTVMLNAIDQVVLTLLDVARCDF